MSSLPLPRDRLRARRAALAISRIGRSRWHIENHGFQALKSRSGIHLGRTFGHGKGHLWSVFACLMILAFAIDPLQALGSRMFQAAWAKVDHTISVLWDDLRNALKSSAIYSWEMLFRLLALPGRSATSEHRPGPHDPPHCRRRPSQPDRPHVMGWETCIDPFPTLDGGLRKRLSSAILQREILCKSDHRL